MVGVRGQPEGGGGGVLSAGPTRKTGGLRQVLSVLDAGQVKRGSLPRHIHY